MINDHIDCCEMRNKICEHCEGKFSHEFKIFNGERSRHINPGHCINRRFYKKTCFEEFIEVYYKLGYKNANEYI